jgi:hypothetical protein
MHYLKVRDSIKVKHGSLLEILKIDQTRYGANELVEIWFKL